MTECLDVKTEQRGRCFLKGNIKSSCGFGIGEINHIHTCMSERGCLCVEATCICVHVCVCASLPLSKEDHPKGRIQEVKTTMTDLWSRYRIWKKWDTTGTTRQTKWTVGTVVLSFAPSVNALSDHSFARMFVHTDVLSMNGWRMSETHDDL